MTELQIKTWLSQAALWSLSNGPAIITVTGSAAVAVAASTLHLSEFQILQAVVLLLAMIGTSLVTERFIEGRRIRTKLNEISTVMAELVGNTTKGNARLDSLIICRRDLPPLEERLSGARDVAISGGSLFRLVNEYLSLFEQLAQSGCKLRFLLTDPGSSAADFLSSAVVYESSDVGAYRAQMRAAVNGLTGLASRYPNTCEVKLYSVAPAFSLIRVEKDGSSSTIQVELYPFKLPARDRPTLLIEQRADPRLHGVFVSQFEAMWSSKFAQGADQPLFCYRE